MISKLLIFCAFFIVQNALAQRIIIKDANIIPLSQNTVLTKKSVLIENGKIKQIDDFKNLPQDKTCTIVNAKGKFLMPGLADMHVHLPTENQVDTLLKCDIAAGITHIRVMKAELNQLKLKEKISQNADFIAPNIHYSYLVQ